MERSTIVFWARKARILPELIGQLRRVDPDRSLARSALAANVAGMARSVWRSSQPETRQARLAGLTGGPSFFVAKALGFAWDWVLREA
jgi:hypothetical protein